MTHIVLLRKPETRKKLERWKETLTGKDTDECKMCTKESIKDYMYWKMITNDFPYDHISTKHHMLALKRHVGEMKDLTEDETREYFEIANSLNNDEYTCITLNLGSQRSINKHLHFHLLKYPDNHI